jgi:hypothetical protein
MTTGELRASLRTTSEGFRRLGSSPGGWLLAELVLQVGVDYTARPLPRRYMRRAPKQCFANAAALVRRTRGLTYVEGFVRTARIPFPVHHAWAVNTDGEVYDNTLGDPETCAYVGVPISRHDYAAQTSPDSASVFLNHIGILRVDYIVSRCPALREMMPA